MLAVLKAALSMLAALGNALGLLGGLATSYMQHKQAKEAKEERKEEHDEAQAASDRISLDPAAEWLREFNPSGQAGVAQDSASTKADKAST